MNALVFLFVSSSRGSLEQKAQKEFAGVDAMTSLVSTDLQRQQQWRSLSAAEIQNYESFHLPKMKASETFRILSPLWRNDGLPIMRLLCQERYSARVPSRLPFSPVSFPKNLPPTLQTANSSSSLHPPSKSLLKGEVLSVKSYQIHVCKFS